MMSHTHQMNPCPPGVRALLVVAVAALLMMTGCDMTDRYNPTTPDQATQATENLKTLPSLEDTEAQVRAIIEQIGARVSAIAPSLTWRWHHEPSQGNCSPPFDKSHGQIILMAKYISDTPIPEEAWAQIFAIARDAAIELGTTRMEVFKDAPGDHDVRFYNETGTAIRIGTLKAALISGATGCRLPRDKK